MARTTTITLGGDLQVARIGYGAMHLLGPRRDDLVRELPDHLAELLMLGREIEVHRPKTSLFVERSGCQNGANTPTVTAGSHFCDRSLRQV